MFANIILVVAVTAIAAKPQRLLGGADGDARHHVPHRGGIRPAAADRCAGALRAAGRQHHVRELLGDRRRLRDGQVRRPGDRAAAAARDRHRRGAAVGHERRRRAPQDAPVGQARRLQPLPLVGVSSAASSWSTCTPWPGTPYLHGEFLKTGKVPAGAEVAVQMATVAGRRPRRDGRVADAALHHGHPL